MRIQGKANIKERLGSNVWKRLGSRIPETRKDALRKPFIHLSQRTIQLITEMRRLDNKESEQIETQLIQNTDLSNEQRMFHDQNIGSIHYQTTGSTPLKAIKPTPFKPVRSPIYSPTHFETNQTFQPNLNESTQDISTNWDTNKSRRIFNHNWTSPFVINHSKVQAGKVHADKTRKARSVDSVCDSMIDPIKKVRKWKKVNESGLPQKVKPEISHL